MDNSFHYKQIRRFNHEQPNHISPGELSSLLTHIGNLHPTLFIVELTHHYEPVQNVTFIEVIATGERFPGQFQQ